jgi:hypothetical protein
MSKPVVPLVDRSLIKASEGVLRVSLIFMSIYKIVNKCDEEVFLIVPLLDPGESIEREFATSLQIHE